ncbi:DUF1127 domain-containing protein [Phyllobacterium meliloti]|uniref:DUF1127 domain-containing protein n=1 Tax=Phyllobacterium meliloti TaxID=555317 RepID=UPI001D146E06|nr:hypothetical protein [Phyllobacterium sp. T1293]UGX86072.1 hypothetical protein LLE53_016825 [Phyllobacterium sp. T1293]
MNMIDFGIVDTVKRLWTGYTHTREEMRTERAINNLPDYLLKDIGWPDAYAERLAMRNSVKDIAAGNDNASAIRRSDRLLRPTPHRGRKTSQNGHLTLEY